MTRQIPALLLLTMFVLTMLVATVLAVLPTQAQSPLPVSGTVDVIANLRSGPGTANALAGQTQPGQTVTVVEVSAGGDLVQAGHGVVDPFIAGQPGRRYPTGRAFASADRGAGRHQPHDRRTG